LSKRRTCEFPQEIVDSLHEAAGRIDDFVGAITILRLEANPLV
jgi:hypothetical protein